MMTAGVEFSTDNAFARFANGVVEDLRMGAERLVRQLEDPEALDGQGAFGPVSKNVRCLTALPWTIIRCRRSFCCRWRGRSLRGTVSGITR